MQITSSTENQDYTLFPPIDSIQSKEKNLSSDFLSATGEFGSDEENLFLKNDAELQKAKTTEELLAESKAKSTDNTYYEMIIAKLKDGGSFVDVMLEAKIALFEEEFKNAIESNGGNVTEAVNTAKLAIPGEISDQELLGAMQNLSTDFENINGDLAEDIAEYVDDLVEEIEDEKETERLLSESSTNDSVNGNNAISTNNAFAVQTSSAGATSFMGFEKNIAQFDMKKFQSNLNFFEESSSNFHATKQNLAEDYQPINTYV